MRAATRAGILALMVFASMTSSALPMRPGRETRGNLNSNIPVRVLLQKRTQSVILGWNQSSLYLADKTRASSLPGNGRMELTWRDSGRGPQVVSKHPSMVSSDLWIAPANSASGLLEFNHRFYRGAIEIKADDYGLLVVNKLPMEDYLLGMLSGEMSAHWEPEALKAQAIAARSYAFYRSLYPRSPHYDLDSTTQDQVYQGEGSEKPATTIAVRATQGIFLADNGLPIAAYFHARCGGSTETSQVVWNTTAPAGAHRVPCPFCRQKPYLWKASWDRKRFFEALHLNASSFSRVFLKALGKSPSGRLTSIQVATNEEKRTLTSDQFRSLLGYDQLKSAHFDWEISDDEIHFQGVGFGHGVGMCQWGARELARQGRDFHQILSYYYPGVTLAENTGKKKWN